MYKQGLYCKLRKMALNTLDGISNHADYITSQITWAYKWKTMSEDEIHDLSNIMTAYFSPDYEYDRDTHRLFDENWNDVT